MRFRYEPPRISAAAMLDRVSARRGDEAWVAEKREAPESRFLLLADLKLPVTSSADRRDTRLRWLSAAEIAGCGIHGPEAALLGTDAAGKAYFAVHLAPFSAAFARITETFAPFVDLRSLGVQGAMPSDELCIAGQARALLAWHATARCCGRCGAATAMRDAGWRRRCTACGLDAYPRSDPAVIMLVTDGERCLVGHEHRFPPGLYSVLAGFVEPGDDIEHAVRREVYEEAGVRIGRAGYLGSQPWPFPHGFMIACWAEALNTQLTLDATEIKAARWADRAEIHAMLTGSHPEGIFAPPPMSIAHSLMRAFVDNPAPPWEGS